MDIATLIRVLQVKKHVTGNEVARRCGWAPSYYHDMLNRNDPKISILEKVADALDCELIIDFKEKRKN